jgi:hypothetical protein
MNEKLINFVSLKDQGRSASWLFGITAVIGSGGNLCPITFYRKHGVTAVYSGRVYLRLPL